MSSTKRSILVTAALPYANGDIHIGHLVEYIQADIFTRFQRLIGNECLYICADDTHGTPIMLKARELNTSPEKMIEAQRLRHIEDFQKFGIEFSNYSSTNSEINKALSLEFYHAMKQKNHIIKKKVSQKYCNTDNMFLPDRFVKGTCPKCNSNDQYGDSCDTCGSTYSASELKNVHCSLCKNTPVEKESEHLFFHLEDFHEFLASYVKAHTQVEVAKKLEEWLAHELKDWNISRDEPYFGFEIPDMSKKYFYVWVDAPVGYISSTKEWCLKNNKQLDDYWKNESTELYHFIGKDIVYFHTLFWPAMLKTAGYRLPNKIFVHGFLTVNGEKMSKSKGTFIKAADFAKHLSPSYLRYYLASKMSGTIDDIDLSIHDMTARINSDLVGKIANLCSRGAQMLNKKLDGVMSTLDEDGKKIVTEMQQKSNEIKSLYENREFSKVVNTVRNLADLANQYFDEKKPWTIIKEEPQQVKEILTSILNMYRIIVIYLKPILPEIAKTSEQILAEPSPLTWSNLDEVVTNRRINVFEKLVVRVEQKDIDKVLDESRT